MKLKIIVTTHKAYKMPEDPIYLPVLVGPAKNQLKGYQTDAGGENISEKNPTYCELTAFYWGWKNLDADYIGLVHYRRHFSAVKAKDKWSSILTGAQAEKIISQMEKSGQQILLPKKRYYVIETLYSHYVHSHHEEDLKALEEILQKKFPEYLDCYQQVMKRRSAHMFNMCIMRREVLDRYCSWLFAVLEETEKILDISHYTDFDKRVFGRLSELLMDVWISQNKISYKELAMINMDGENWPHKIALFLKRKIAGKKNV